jgi:hypothetical protein
MNEGEDLSGCRPVALFIILFWLFVFYLFWRFW